MMSLFGFIKSSLQEMCCYPEAFWVHVLDQWGVKISQAGITDGLSVDIFVDFMRDEVNTLDDGLSYRWVDVLINIHRDKLIDDEYYDEHTIHRILDVPCSKLNCHSSECSPLGGKSKVAASDLNEIHSQSSVLLRQMPVSFQLGLVADHTVGFCYADASASIHSQWSVVSDKDDCRILRVYTFSLDNSYHPDVPILNGMTTMVTINRMCGAAERDGMNG